MDHHHAQSTSRGAPYASGSSYRNTDAGYSPKRQSHDESVFPQLCTQRANSYGACIDIGYIRIIV